MRNIWYRTGTGWRILIVIIATLAAAGIGIVSLLAITSRTKKLN